MDSRAVRDDTVRGVSPEPQIDYKEKLPKEWHFLQRLLHNHPAHCNAFSQAIYIVFYDFGALSYPRRHYLALMAASQHQCKFLMELHRKEFLRVRGDPAWLDGIEFASEKMKKMDIINLKLAHKPWALTVEEVFELKKPNNYLLNELVQAIFVIVQTHMLCTLLFACNNFDGTTFPESDVDLMKSLLKNPGAEKTAGDTKREVEGISCVGATGNGQIDNGTSGAENRKVFLEIDEPQSESCIGNRVPFQQLSLAEEFMQYSSNPGYGYVDFVQCAKNKEAKTRKAKHFIWCTTWYDFVDRYYRQMADVIHRRFSITKKLIYHTQDEENDAAVVKYRLAIWNYAQSLYGICHEEYNYAEVNQVLDRKTKIFIKTLCCYPHRVTQQMRDEALVHNEEVDRVYALLLVMEARLEAQICYFLACFDKAILMPI